ALFVFLRYTVGQAFGDLSRPLGADILANHCSGEVRMQAREYLCDAAACRISPNNDVSKLELLRHAFDVLDVVFDKIRALRVPTGLTMPTHVDGHDLIVLVEVGCDVVKRVRHTADTVQHDQRLLIARAPIQIMDAKTVDGDETVHGLGLR